MGYGLLLTDCHMPFIDGYKLTGLIRDRELTAKGRHLPVVALTANALAGEAEICRAAGMDDYLSKPTNLGTLNAAIRKWLPGIDALRRPRHGGASAAGAPAARGGTPDKAAVPPIDVEALARAADAADDTFVREMLSLFRDSEAGTAAELQTIVRAKDPDALAVAAHTAKGAARSAFAVALGDALEALEAAAARRDWPSAGALMAKIENEYRTVFRFIDRYGADAGR
jgi:CheY-like chemotaxis protein